MSESRDSGPTESIVISPEPSGSLQNHDADDGEAFDLASVPDVLPVLPLRDSLVFPYIIVPLSVRRATSLAAVDQALAESRIVLLASSAEAASNGGEEESEEIGPLHEIGVVALIMRMLKLPDGRVRVLVQGLCRAGIQHVSQTRPFVRARIRPLADQGASPAQGDGEARAAAPSEEEVEVNVRATKDLLERAVQLGRPISSEVMVIAANLEDPGRLADLAASNLDLGHETGLEILSCLDPLLRLKRVNELLSHEVRLLTMQFEIASQARDEMDRSQREYFLRQQLRTIQEELGEAGELEEEIESYRAKARDLELGDEAAAEVERQLRRLEKGHPDSAESSVIRTFLDWLLGLPWQQVTVDNLDLERARRVLDEDHYDLERVKQRILEFLAVRKLKPDAKGPILCLVGPPGVGKTSLGRSVARALGRRFVRIALGGVRDEAEIRGHRRTYVGAMPGRILQGLRQAGTSNPVFMLDEIDKIGSDFRGDPAAALLEVLDPAQNDSFRDHYLGVEYDLSRVLFLTTANLLDPIPAAFRDRLEVLRLSGYTLPEKLQIATRHLVPQQLVENGLDSCGVHFSSGALRRVIRDYTREPGLRELERSIGSICRKLAYRLATEPNGERTAKVIAGGRPATAGSGSDEAAPRSFRITARQIPGHLGPARHFSEEALEGDRVGVATGLAWTAAGGDLLIVEAISVPGKGELKLTGQLGEVMRESAQAALSFVRGHLAREDPATGGRIDEIDLHVHVPAGSVPKDGPSAGITIAAALLSLLLGRAVRADLAMTGELTLRGDVLPIGGLREKILAADAAGLRTVLIPKANLRDLEEIRSTIRRKLQVRAIASMHEVIDLALLPRTPRDGD
ncbi:MAG: endopeptidase La [Acidobacteria bacterium]|nr:MAG: endopeptidase La [Acidobacteriota bacterium]REK11635.1 MAG: endopeptidase La [Acidobacteriota bacterium]